ncbi:MAG TPA: ATP synthase subunit I [Allocoleopsis sp.]
MNLPNIDQKNIPEEEKTDVGNNSTSNTNKSMTEFYQLQQRLLIVTLILTGIIFISVWVVYSLNIALSYLLGACTGVVYLRMLGKNVAEINSENRRFNSNRLALVAGLVIIGSRWNQLQIVPVFLGFLTYKAALIIYMLQITLLPEKKVN